MFRLTSLNLPSISLTATDRTTALHSSPFHLSPPSLKTHWLNYSFHFKPNLFNLTTDLVSWMMHKRDVKVTSPLSVSVAARLFFMRLLLLLMYQFFMRVAVGRTCLNTKLVSKNIAMKLFSVLINCRMLSAFRAKSFEVLRLGRLWCEADAWTCCGVAGIHSTLLNIRTFSPEKLTKFSNC